MKSKNHTLLDSIKTLAVVYFDIEKSKVSLRPFFCGLFPQEMYIEYGKDLTELEIGQVIEVDVIKKYEDDEVYWYGH